ANKSKDLTTVVVYLKHTGEVRMTPVTINADRKIILRPFEGHRPVLKLDPDAKEAKPALFNVTTGQIQFENLEIQLSAGKFGTESIVALSGNGHCSFKLCVL